MNQPAALLVAFFALVGSLLAAEPDARFRFEPVDDKSLKLWDGDKPVFVYNFGLVTPRPNAKPRGSYLHPLYGMDGEVLTDDAPADHVYHRGLYWAWMHIKIGDKEYDSWNMRDLRNEFGKWIAKETRADGAMLSVENGWFAGDKKVMTEQVVMRASPASGDSRSIDVELTWTPTDQPITLWGAEGKSYGGLALRFGPRTKTVITVPTGVASEDLVMTKLPWADFSGDIKSPGAMSGAAIFVGADHPDYPPTWMTRSYGMLAVGWPGVNPQTIEKGKSVTCRYRIWIHRGAPDVKQIQKAYDEYRATK